MTTKRPIKLLTIVYYTLIISAGIVIAIYADYLRLWWRGILE